MVLARPVEITLDTLLTAFRHVGCGDPHLIFAGGLRYIPPSSRNGEDRAAFEELGGLGFTEGKRLTSDFEDVLHILDRPNTEYYATVRTEAEQYSVLVAVRGRAAVTAICEGNRVWLKGVRTSDRAAALVMNLPEYPPARFTPFSLPQDDFKDSRSRDARWLDDVFEQPYFGVGFFAAAKRPNGEKRTEATDGLTYLDLDAGRVAMHVSGSPQNRYITVLPGDPTLLSQKVAALRASLDH
ncbi:ESX secretion-associated protein EspG [Amycolatopsis sp. WAC 01375]|uniref:ESX secretion-associated protein EspG n=1 Tax=Amycolatopsis sp. WAC 01375 TaxID=2203194 RepID=UPI000F7B1D75|nr:ESX secretion-associated protein EspG [Amycolatopsis sp. WAC 01375]RSM71016.1 ESX secretion-associated protein EspG [Amycolatopsis sp. WAC 01375]